MSPRAMAAAMLLAAGCGSTPQYGDLPDKNLQVRTAAQGAAVVMGVHRLDAKCFAHYEGAVQLDRPVVDVGLPQERRSLLVFEFYSRSLLSGSRSLKREARITPRTGYRYEAVILYKDALYNVDLFEVDPRSGSRRELDARRDC